MTNVMLLFFYVFPRHSYSNSSLNWTTRLRELFRIRYLTLLIIQVASKQLSS